MTSIPARNGTIDPTLKSLRDQTRQPDEIRLYLGPGCDHVQWSGYGPPLVCVPAVDCGPVTKLAAAADPCVQADALIVTVDDDVIYAPRWLETLLEHVEKFPDDAIGIAGWYANVLLSTGRYERASGPCDVLEGFGGVAYHKWFFGPDILEPPDHLKYVDDVWISGYLHRLEIIRRVVPGQAALVDTSRSANLESIHTRRDFDTLNKEGVRSCFPHLKRVGAARERRIASRNSPTPVRHEAPIASSNSTAPSIIICHSQHERCGIREYGQQLDQSIRNATRSLAVFTHDSYKDMTNAVTSGAVVLVHFEWNLLMQGFDEALQRVRDRGGRTVMCCHWFGSPVIDRFAQLADRFVVHRKYNVKHSSIVQIPLGCPVYDPPNEPRDVSRRRLGLPTEATIATTVGFLTEWKQFPLMIDAILRYWPEDDKGGKTLFIQMLTPTPFRGDQTDEIGKIRTILRQYESKSSQIQFSTEFLPEHEVLDRIHCSDFGFLYHGEDTGSVSAATKQFVSARCPLVTTGSTHASDLLKGVVRSPGVAGRSFVQHVLALAAPEAADERARLRAEMEDEYRRINMDVVAQNYLHLFNTF